jgi:8-oxo-dGTP pyrophosphatase MutT (NUDIX family)
MKGIEVIVRALILRDSHVLLAHKIGADNTFLPGGHVELGETLREALLRELREELEGEVEVGGFLGALEHFYPTGLGSVHELNLIFECDLRGCDLKAPPGSKEPHLEFLWEPVSVLERRNLHPGPLVEAISGMSSGSAFPRYMSTLRGGKE